MFKNALQVILIFLCLLTGTLFAQKPATQKYPSLFWEITGNGLKKPSYLFGTMHVSSKMVFHLSDSFYNAISRVDAVGLELNPEVWQGQMVKLDQLKNNYSSFIQNPSGAYLNENSFRINSYEDEIKSALSTEPTIVNNLLYRSFKTKEDFEEDTFLDLYIYQTGRKLGKRATGVEDYYETEKLVLEAYADMANEKKKKKIDLDQESLKDIGEKIQDAYRRGDLDLMDSLTILTDASPAFREKFLYKRNEIQAASMDSIMKKSSLFVGVGAAHLPGDRGVIELLRKMGYHLRPIKMTDRDAARKEAIDNLKVPVQFSTIQSDDGFFKVDMPGPLYKMSDEYQRLDRRQYSDMNNGSYYLVTRVKTHTAMLGQNEGMVKKKIDSLLYENIPGKILKKTPLQRNGYNGYDIINKTRRGNIQRYNIFITPFEVLIFKMSGKENYVNGSEANRFFSSIQLKERDSTSLVFTPKQGGFSVKLPQKPSAWNNPSNSDNIDRWEYDALDNTTGDAYLLLKKSIYNFRFLDEDSFELKLMEESFRSPDFFERQLYRKVSVWNGYPCLDITEKMKDSSIIKARFIIKGPHYYVLATRSKKEQNDFSDFFNSFHFTPYVYNNSTQYTDTFMHFSVTTPVIPELDNKYRAALEKMSVDISNGNNADSYYSYWPKRRNAFFSSDSTGEAIGVSIQKYPAYYYVKDSATFWKNVIAGFYNEDDLVLQQKEYFENSNNVRGYRFSLRDTGSSKTINRMIMLKDNYMFSIVSMGDTLNHQSSFIKSFFEVFQPENKKLGRNIFINCLDSFFADFNSSDSTIHSRAQKAISDIHYGEQGVPKILSTIQNLKQDKDYFENKTKFIAELGYIQDSTKPVVAEALKKIYEQTVDTSIFQNEVIEALARHKSGAAIKLFKELMLQDPPVYNNSYAYTSLFSLLHDSLKLAATLYPDLLQLTAVDDYKNPVLSLLVTLVDSGMIKAEGYESYFNKLYFDAKIELKKQQGKDELKMEAERKKDDDEDASDYAISSSYGMADMNDYAVLLAPFYDKNNNVPKYFDKLLRSKDDRVRMNTALVLLKNSREVPDSIFISLASKDQFRGKLYRQLENINRLDRFPSSYKTQQDLARSYLVSEKDYSKIDSIVFISKQPASFNNKKGTVYFFKYRVKKDDDWKIGISGLQPEDPQNVSSNNELASMTDKKLKEDKPVNEQLQEQLKRLLYNFHKSAKYFFDTDRFSYRYNNTDEDR